MPICLFLTVTTIEAGEQPPIFCFWHGYLSFLDLGDSSHPTGLQKRFHLRRLEHLITKETITFVLGTTQACGLAAGVFWLTRPVHNESALDAERGLFTYILTLQQHS